MIKLKKTVETENRRENEEKKIKTIKLIGLIQILDKKQKRENEQKWSKNIFFTCFMMHLISLELNLYFASTRPPKNKKNVNE